VGALLRHSWHPPIDFLFFLPQKIWSGKVE
jgi:hypothetical protein